MCVIKLYKTDKEMSDADFTTHENDEFTEEVDWENGLGCIAQPLVSHDFVLIKFATKKTVKYFIGLIHDMDRDSYNTRSLNKRSIVGYFLPNVEDSAVLDLTDIVSKNYHNFAMTSLKFTVVPHSFKWKGAHCILQRSASTLLGFTEFNLRR